MFLHQHSTDETFTLEKLSKLNLTIRNTHTFQEDGLSFPPTLKIPTFAEESILLSQQNPRTKDLFDTISKKKCK